MLAVDMVLFEPVLSTLLDNAAKNLPLGSSIKNSGDMGRRGRNDAAIIHDRNSRTAYDIVAGGFDSTG